MTGYISHERVIGPYIKLKWKKGKLTNVQFVFKCFESVLKVDDISSARAQVWTHMRHLYIDSYKGSERARNVKSTETHTQMTTMNTVFTFCKFFLS